MGEDGKGLEGLTVGGRKLGDLNIGSRLRSRPCGGCLHLWNKEPKNIQFCGKEKVKQYTCEAARRYDGDCGPDGRYYVNGGAKFGGL